MERGRSLDGTTIAWSREGSGPALVLVHGALCDHRAWDRVVPRLAPHVTVYAIDRRGRGASGDIAPYAVEREVEDILAVLDTIDAPAHILGHSSGAILALEVVLRSQAIRSVVLYEPPLFVGALRPRPPRDLPERLEALVASGDRDGAVSAFLHEAVGQPDAAIEPLRTHPLWGQFAALAHTTPYDARIAGEYVLVPSQLKSLRVPTLLLLGERSPAWVEAGTQTLAAALPSGRIAILADQEHNAIFAAPDLFAREVAPFLSAED